MPPAKGRMGYTTEIPPAKSRAQIYGLLDSAGALQISIGTNGQDAIAAFALMGRMIRVSQPLPVQPDTPRAKTAGTRNQHTGRDPWVLHDQEERRRWRMLYRIIELQLELLKDEVLDVDDAFMPFILLPDNSVVRDHARPTIAETYESGQMPTSILPVPSPAKVIALGAGRSRPSSTG